MNKHWLHCSLALLTLSSVSRAADVPVALTGWNADDIAGASEAFPYSNNNVNGWNFYQPGIPGGTQGLPVNASRVLTSAAGTPFQLAPYNGNNTSFVNNGDPQTLSLVAPGHFTQLQFLDVDANGFPTNWNVTLNFHDGSHTTFSNFADSDWTNGTTNGSVAFTNYGLVAQNDPTNIYNGGLSAYEHDVVLSAADGLKQLDSITLTNITTPNGGTVMFLGLSGVPEPSSFVLCGLGALGLLAAARRRLKA